MSNQRAPWLPCLFSKDEGETKRISFKWLIKKHGITQIICFSEEWRRDVCIKCNAVNTFSRPVSQIPNAIRNVINYLPSFINVTWFRCEREIWIVCLTYEAQQTNNYVVKSVIVFSLRKVYLRIRTSLWSYVFYFLSCNDCIPARMLGDVVFVYSRSERLRLDAAFRWLFSKLIVGSLKICVISRDSWRQIRIEVFCGRYQQWLNFKEIFLQYIIFILVILFLSH